MTGRKPGGLGIFKRFGRDRSGASGVEFALIAPVLILIYFGLAEFCQAYMAQRRMSHSTSQVADIVAQYQVVDADLLDDTFALGALVMAPFPTAAPPPPPAPAAPLPAALRLRVSAVTRGTDGVARVVWSRAQGTTKRSGPVTVPDGLIANGESIIMSEGWYDFKSTLGQVLPGTRTFNRTYWLRPRLVNEISCTGAC